MTIELKTLPARRLAYLRHTGPYGSPGIGQAWHRFSTWAGTQGLKGSTMYGISQDDPSATPPAQCRYDCCVEVDTAFAPQGDIGVQDFAGGTYACVTFTGTGATIPTAWRSLFSEGLPGWWTQNNCQPGNGPALELYEQDFMVDEATGTFRCWLCVPVQPR